MKKINLLVFAVLVTILSYAQGHFVPAFIGSGQNHMNIYVATATIGGVDLEVGDEIASFDGSVCCGIVILTQPILLSDFNTFAAIAASQKDVGLTNGFTTGNPITYKLWDASKSKEISGLTAEYLDLITQLPVTAPTYSPGETAIVKLSVAALVNQIPVSNAGSDQSLNEGDNVILDGSASSDPDSDPLSYSWTAPAGITLNSTTVANPSFTAPEVNINTNYTFSLIVNDGVINSTADQVVITVKQVNKVPVANAGVDQSLNEGVTVTLDGTTSSDPDSDVLTYLWTTPAGVTLSSTTVSRPTFTAPEVMINTNYTFSLVVNDGKVNSAADQVVVTVNQVNKAPVANAGPDQSPNENTLITLDGSGSSDPDNNTITYLWTAPAGITLNSTTVAKPTFIGPEVNTDTPYTFSLVVNDGTLNSTADQVVITVKQVNKVPVANAGVDQSLNEGVTVTLDGTTSSDPDSDVLTYLWTAPAGVTLSSTTVSKPTFTAPEVMINTNYTFSLVVNDGKVNSAADQVVVTVNQVNKAPVANAGSDASITEKKVFQLDGSISSDPDNNLLTYKWTAPSGITLNSTTVAKPTFTAPDVIVNTIYTISLMVNDGTIDSPVDQVAITVVPNKAPVSNAGPDQTVAQEQTVILNGSLSSDLENDALTYQWSVPAGITLINSNSGNPSFKAPAVVADTDFSIKLKVNDGELDSPEDEVIIRVLQNQFPVANAGANFTVNEGTAVSLDGSASFDPDNDALTYLWTTSGGITLSSAVVAKPTFIAPEVNTDIDYSFSLVVSDGIFNSSVDQVVVTIKQVNKAPVSNAGPDQSVNENSLYTLDGSFSSDPDSDVITYKWMAPTGITLSSSTVAKPTFTSPDVNINTNYTFTLVVNDGKMDSPADQVVITVKQDNKAPVANAGIDQSVNEGSLVTLDGLSSSDLDGDALIYKWTSPEGILLSSTTDSKPTFTAPEVTTDTDYLFSIVVNDGTVNSVADQVVITVKHVNKLPVSNAGTDQSVSELEMVALDGSASSDPDNNALTYLWTAPSGITLSSTTTVKPTFTAPQVSIDTNYTFTLVVNDGTDNSQTDQVIVTIANVDHVPYVKNLIKDVSVDKRSPDQIIDLTSVFADDDLSDVLTYTISSNTNDKVVSPKITGTSLALSFSTENIGTSEIIITANSNGKEAKSKFNVEVKIPTGIEMLIEDADAQIYPNPTKGNIYMKFSQSPKIGTWITVFDISGKMILKSLVDSKENYINLKGNPTGLYFLKIDQKTSKTYKVILE